MFYFIRLILTKNIEKEEGAASLTQSIYSKGLLLVDIPVRMRVLAISSDFRFRPAFFISFF
jgi:hypothetical protein